MNKNEEQYKIYKQVVHPFYHNSNEKTKEIQSKEINLKIELYIIYLITLFI